MWRAAIWIADDIAALLAAAHVCLISVARGIQKSARYPAVESNDGIQLPTTKNRCADAVIHEPLILAKGQFVECAHRKNEWDIQTRRTVLALQVVGILNALLKEISTVADGERSGPRER